MEKKRILIVDDEKQIINLLVASLENFNCKIHFAANGVEAYNQIKLKPFDLIITDYNMPKMNGLELTRKIKSIKPSLPILVVTGDGPVDDLLKSGAEACISKPFPVRKLQLLVQFILNQ